MSTPVATIADALFAFIMSLLRDPAAAEEFAAAPKAALAHNGLDDACAADVRAVKPVIVDHVSVTPKPPTQPQQFPPTDQHNTDPDPVVTEITRILNQFTSIDARTTIVDQSTNQNIWTDGGDVTQIFDQEAVVASGDDAIAAGEDATLVDSEVDVTVGDVSVGNTTNTDSFNNTDIDVDETLTADEALTAAAPADAEASSDAAALAGDAVQTAVDAVTDAAEPVVEAPAVEAPVEQPSDLLSADLTATDDTYEADAAASAAAAGEPLLEEPAEEQ